MGKNKPSKGWKVDKYIHFLPMFLLFSSIFTLSKPSRGQQQDSLRISIDLVTISDTLIFREKQANFPYPVLSLITIKDSYGAYVHGLADTKTWLGPQDTTRDGVLIDNIWKTILEYHEEDPSIPSDPDVKNMSPEYMVTYLVTEMLGVEGYGATVAMVMDYSNSLGNDIYIAEDASKVFIRETTDDDRIAIVKFARKVMVYQNFTNDTTLLMEAIEKPFTERHGTALYQALYEGITACLNEPGRTAVVAYTDGRDNRWGFPRVDDVIDYAKNNYVNIYIIGLGDDIDVDELKMISKETGGEYYSAPSVEDMADIYIRIYNSLSGYYALAHMSTDTLFNGTWRVVDIIVNDNGMEGRGTCHYYVPHIPSIHPTKKVITDSTSILNGDTLHYAMVADTVLYEITVYNEGKGHAKNVKVVDELADSLTVIDFQNTPDTITPDSIIWMIPQIDSAGSYIIRYRAQVAPKMDMGKTELVNAVRVSCQYDSLDNDNESQSILNALSLPDFKIRLTPPKTSASPGYEFPISASIENLGNGDATEPFTVGFFIESTGTAPVATSEISNLTLGDTTWVDFSWIFNQEGEYLIIAFVDVWNAIDEIREKNNTDSLFINVSIDSIRLQINNITFSEEIRNIQGEFPNSIHTRIHVLDQNDHFVSKLASQNEWLKLEDATEMGLSLGEFWPHVLEYYRENPSYPIDQNIRTGIQMTEVNDAPVTLVLMLDYSVYVDAWDLSLKTSLTDFVQDFSQGDWGMVMGYSDPATVIEPFTQNSLDLETAIKSSFSSSSRKIYDGLYAGIPMLNDRTGRKAILTVIGGQDEESLHKASEVVHLAQDCSVPVVILQTGEATPSDSLKLIADESGGLYICKNDPFYLNITIQNIDELLRRYYVMNHTSSDTIQNNTYRVLDLKVRAYGLDDQDMGFYRAPYGVVDIWIEKTSSTDYMMITDGDTTWQVQAGDTIDYSLSLKNVGHWAVHNLVVVDSLPPNVNPVSYSVFPDKIANQIVSWTVDSLKLGENARLWYRCFVDTLIERKETLLINQAEIIFEEDTLIENNTSRDTVGYIPLQNGDLTVYKSGVGDSLVVSGEDSIWYVYPGSYVTYKVVLTNQGERDCRDIWIADILPDWASVVEFHGASYEQHNDSLYWTLAFLKSRGVTQSYTYRCQIDTLMPPYEVMLINQVYTDCEEDTAKYNNQTGDTVWVAGIELPSPEIQVSPILIEPRDTVQVKVMSHLPVEEWNLNVYFEDGTEIDTYADDFIRFTDIVPKNWVQIYPDFVDTKMRTTKEREKVGVIIETWDTWEVHRSDTAFFTIQSNNELYLQTNVFRPGQGANLGIRFKISSNRNADIGIYDVAGGFVRRIVDTQLDAGWTYFTWDGRNEQGIQVGSGIYLVVVSSGDFQKALKFILIR